MADIQLKLINYLILITKHCTMTLLNFLPGFSLDLMVSGQGAVLQIWRSLVRAPAGAIFFFFLIQHYLFFVPKSYFLIASILSNFFPTFSPTFLHFFFNFLNFFFNTFSTFFQFFSPFSQLFFNFFQTFSKPFHNFFSTF